MISGFIGPTAGFLSFSIEEKAKNFSVEAQNGRPTRILDSSVSKKNCQRGNPFFPTAAKRFSRNRFGQCPPS